MDLFTKFDQVAGLQPNKFAFIHFDKKKKDWKTTTYKQLHDLTTRFFHGLSAYSLTPGLRAAVMTPPSVEFFALAIAMLKFGIIPIVVDPAIGLKKLEACLVESKPDIFIGNGVTHALRIVFGWGRGSVKYNLSISKIERGKGKANTQSSLPTLQLAITNQQSPSTFHSPLSTPAAIIFTSGSTGTPKGVLYTHENLFAQFNLLQKNFNISEDEIDLPAFPLYALIDILLGVTSVIPDISFPVPGKTDPKKVMDAIHKFNVTNMFASPIVLELLSSFFFHFPAQKLHTIKRVITAGAPATIDLQKRFRKLLPDSTSLFGIYGATEVLPIAQVESREVFTLEEKTRNGAGICLGKPVEGVTVRIIPIADEPIHEWRDSLEVEPNVVGEITVQGQAVTRGYIREEANQISKIMCHCEGGSPKQSEKPNTRLLRREKYPPRNDMTDVIHRMGDVGYFDDDGRLWYCGRKSHRVVTSDGVMFTEQIENIFNAHPLVKRSALVGVEGEPVLWVELERGLKVKKDKIKLELIEIAKTHLQASKIKVFLSIKNFPTDVRHNSKIIREELAKLATGSITRDNEFFELSDSVV